MLKRSSLIMKKTNKRFDEDLEIAKKLQEELDLSEAEHNKSKPPPPEPEKLMDNEWICENCTLKNIYPHFRWDAWEEFNRKAYDVYNERKQQKYRESEDRDSSSLKWTWRFWDVKNDYRDLWISWNRKKYKWDSRLSHWKYCNENSEDKIWENCKKKLDKQKPVVC